MEADGPVGASRLGAEGLPRYDVGQPGSALSPSGPAVTLEHHQGSPHFPAMSAISELEGVVLGIVQSLQPCTAYAVRKRIVSSPSTHWSASGGSIYPLMARLEGAGLVRARADRGDGRQRRLFTLTTKGGRSLRKWILEAGTTDVAANVSDALRARAFFLDALGSTDRRRFAEDALAAARVFLARTREYLDDAALGEGGPEDRGSRDSGEDRLRRLAALAGVYAAEARVRWLKELAALLEAEDS